MLLPWGSLALTWDADTCWLQEVVIAIEKALQSIRSDSQKRGTRYAANAKNRLALPFSLPIKRGQGGGEEGCALVDISDAEDRMGINATTLFIFRRSQTRGHRKQTQNKQSCDQNLTERPLTFLGSVWPHMLKLVWPSNDGIYKTVTAQRK